MNYRLFLFAGFLLISFSRVDADLVVDTSGYDIKYLRLELEASDSSAYIRGKTVCIFLVNRDIPTISFELSDKYIVDSVFINHQPVSWQHNNNRIVINASFLQNQLLESEIFYAGNAGGSGFFSGISNQTDRQWNVPVTWTLSEPFSARDWFPAKQVLTDKIDSSEVVVTVPARCKAGSNGLLIKVDTLPDSRMRYHWKSSYPIAYYLISMAVANYQEYTFYARPYGMNDSLPVVNYVYNHPALLDSYREDINKTKDLIEFYSELLKGYPFPEEKYGHCLAPMGGGMEHQTMTTLSNFGFLLVAHELFHMWFGDKVTCSSWSDIWLNEGFASYGEYLALHHFEGKQAAIQWMNQAHSFAFAMPEGRVYVPPEETTNVYRIFNYNLSYKKGAAILHMLRFETNDDSLFFSALREYLDQYRYGCASVNDFIAVYNRVTGRNWQFFFDQWYYGQGYPIVQVSWQQIGKNILLNVSQKGSSTNTPFFRFTLPVTIYYAGGDSVVLLKIDQAEQYFSVNFPYKIAGIAANTGADILAKTTVIPMDTSGKLMHIYPNPAAGKVKVDFLNQNVSRSISIVNLAGQTVWKQNRNKSFEVDISCWNPGVYILMVTEGTLQYAARLVIP